MKAYKNVFFVIVFSFFVLAFFLWQTKRNITNNTAGNKAFSQLNTQLQQVGDLTNALASAEITTLRYMNGKEDYLREKFRDDSTQLVSGISNIKSFYETNGIPSSSVNQLAVFIGLKMKLYASYINSSPEEPVVPGYNNNIEIKRLDNKINQQLLKIKRENESRFEENIQKLDAYSRNYYLTTLITSLVSFLVVYFVLTGISEQIKKRKRAEQAAELNQKKYREIIDQSGVVLFTSDMAGNFTFVSRYAEKMTGYKPEELIGKNFIQLVEPSWHETVTGFYKNMAQQRLHESTIKFPVIGKNSEKKWVDQQAVLLFDKDTPAGFQCITKDVTEIYLLDEERAKRNQERKEAHLLLQSILDNCPQIIFIKNIDNRYIQVNNQFAEVLGFAHYDIIGKNDKELFGEHQADKFTRIERKVLETGKPIELKQNIQYNNEVRKYSFIIFPLFDPQGKNLGISGIGTDITENVNNHKKIIEALKKAEHAEKMKENFLANMSHEIRTPLNAIIGFGKQLMKSEQTDRNRGFVQNINAASEHLLVLINDILDISKIEQGKMTLEDIGFDFHNAINETIAVMSQKAEEKGLSLVSAFDENINQFLKGDPYRLKQILLNLLGNSIKFTEKGQISVSCILKEDTEYAQQIKIRVQDTGIGMDKEFISNLFDKFSQEDKSVTRKYGGTGLGMAITKHLTGLMGGEIRVESEKNAGTTFIINIPFKKTGNIYEESQLQHPVDTTRLQNRKILVVDDVEMNRLVASAVLSEYGVLITEAENGSDAINILKSNPFDMVLMDLQMPVMDGINATRFIRNVLHLEVPIIALTASAMRRDNEKCFEAGMNDYVTKPFSESELLSVIEKHLPFDLPV